MTRISLNQRAVLTSVQLVTRPSPDTAKKYKLQERQTTIIKSYVVKILTDVFVYIYRVLRYFSLIA